MAWIFMSLALIYFVIVYIKEMYKQKNIFKTNNQLSLIKIKSA